MPAHEDYEVPKAPVRDDSALAADEDLDREPDGVPHDVVGFTAFFSVLLAMLVGFMYLTHNTAAQVAAVLLALIAIPVLVSTMRKRADVHRDHLHPSR